ncbi:MAG: hypothetical protein RSC93_04330 [Erysipelotrichaceae bacterium]
MNEKHICEICGKEFTIHSNQGLSRKICYDCVPEHLDRNKIVSQKKKSLKLEGMKRLGGRCCHCQEDNYRKLQFHHVDKSQKIASISELMQALNYDGFFSEIDKCILLCANCHLDFHAREAEEKITIEDYLGRTLSRNFYDVKIPKEQFKTRQGPSFMREKFNGNLEAVYEKEKKRRKNERANIKKFYPKGK